MTIRVRTLSAEERAELTRMARSRTLCAGRVKRAQLVLLVAEGRKAGEIGEGLRLHAKTARFWLKRFNAHGLAGLEESERPGRPPVYSADQVGAVIGAALTRPAELGLPFAWWTLDRLVAYLGEAKGIAMRRSRVGEMLLPEGLRWRQEETWFGRAGRPRVRPKRGRSSSSTPPRPRAASSSASTRWARRPARAIPAAGPVRPDASPAERAKQEIDYGRRGPAATCSAPSAPRPGRRSPRPTSAARSATGSTSWARSRGGSTPASSGSTPSWTTSTSTPPATCCCSAWRTRAGSSSSSPSTRPT